MSKNDEDAKFEAAICQKLNVGLEWLDGNYANADDAGKRAIDGLRQGICLLALMRGYRVNKSLVDSTRNWQPLL